MKIKILTGDFLGDNKPYYIISCDEFDKLMERSIKLSNVNILNIKGDNSELIFEHNPNDKRLEITIDSPIVLFTMGFDATKAEELTRFLAAKYGDVTDGRE